MIYQIYLYVLLIRLWTYLFCLHMLCTYAGDTCFSLGNEIVQQVLGDKLDRNTLSAPVLLLVIETQFLMARHIFHVMNILLLMWTLMLHKLDGRFPFFILVLQCRLYEALSRNKLWNTVSCFAAWIFWKKKRLQKLFQLFCGSNSSIGSQ